AGIFGHIGLDGARHASAGKKNRWVRQPIETPARSNGKLDADLRFRANASVDALCSSAGNRQFSVAACSYLYVDTITSSDAPTRIDNDRMERILIFRFGKLQAITTCFCEIYNARQITDARAFQRDLP